ncbi:Histone-binding protein RBBP4 or subunit C of CAF1 complex [Carpediemonas membranifera]|uniref:Histone-binding protein RBBP4 or subunit C of CAF1 complex n=1 Tax=Carpediemonas membranifera TaxID=201153 RepID=A0A8J6B088_9EUKA|nr:Histone-binding protein RBBP4 or subunit C of CAF1 complex [Carpediemonas membranifera]|eukprot:KAG9390197.1 Histone-binding protein RBBP4 or subunit C of CAF1 complex [Carpediemonas membranifera]
MDAQQVENERRSANRKAWKKNAPYFNDMVLSEVMEWPSLTFQFFPDKQVTTDNDLAMIRTLSGTNAMENPDELDSLLISTFTLPANASLITSHDVAAVSIDTKLTDTIAKDGADPDAVLVEMGGFVELRKLPDAYNKQMVISYGIEQRIRHNGEVNKARLAPNNANLIAARGPDRAIHIFDRVNQPGTGGLLLRTDREAQPDFTLTGMADEGFPLDWAPGVDGMLAAGDNSGVVALWDLNKADGRPTATWDVGDAVCDLAWHPTASDIVVIAGDATCAVFDARTQTVAVDFEKPAMAAKACPLDPYAVGVCRAGAFERVDMRQPLTPVTVTETPSETYCLSWSPHVPYCAVGCEDGEVCLISLDGALSHVHGDHTRRVNDVDWHPNLPWTLGSVGDDCRLSVWQPDRSVVG